MNMKTEKGQAYVVSTYGTCEVTTPDGILICTAVSGTQGMFVAPTTEVILSDANAILTPCAGFKGALVSASGGGSIAADNVWKGANTFENGIQVLPLGAVTVAGADAYGLSVTATGGLQLWGTHFLMGDLWSDTALKVVQNEVSLYSTSEASIGFDYADTVHFRTMPNSGAAANDGQGAVFDFRAWKWADDSHSEKLATAPVQILKTAAGEGTLTDESLLNRAEGDARWALAEDVPIAFIDASYTAPSAGGGYSLAVGSRSTANFLYGTAVGICACTTSTNGTAVGYSCTASTYGTAVGNSAAASSYGAAYGASAKASGSYTVAIGYNSSATLSYNLAIGYAAKASGSGAFCIGKSAAASAEASFALGVESTASAWCSFALGKSSQATASFDAAMGHYAEASGGSSTAVGACAVTNGSSSTAVGVRAAAEGDSAVAIGRGVTVKDDGTVGIGAFGDEEHTKQTILYMIAAGSALAETYYPAETYGDNNGCMGFVSKGSDGTIYASGLRRLADLFTDYAYDSTTGEGFVATLALDEEEGGTTPQVFLPSGAAEPIDTSMPCLPDRQAEPAENTETD